MSLNDWSADARLLTVGSKRKVSHCTNTPTAYISNSNAGVGLHCFRCGESAFVPHGERSLAEILATRWRIEDQVSAGPPGMPADAVSLTEAPDAALVWLLQGALLPETAEHKFGFKWHDGLQRVLYPILDQHGQCAGIAGRSIDPKMLPKYKVFKGSDPLYWAARRGDRDIVVVEDVLSAIAIYQAGYNAVAVSGTSLAVESAQAIAEYVDYGDRVVIWLDPDKAGRAGWAKMRKTFGLTPCELVRVTSDADPKRLPRTTIQEKLREATRRA